jgi:hypothetical protein
VNQYQQFWWNWWVNLAVAIGTLLTVAVALFGETIRALLLPPRLRLKLLRQGGERTTLTHRNLGVVETIDEVRYYHLHIWNERRWSQAKEVQVYLTRLEEPGPDGDLQIVWFGNVPMRWRDQEFVPILRTIGAVADCDLCRVGRRTGLSLMPLIMPNSLEPFAHRNQRCRLVASLQARSNQADSDVVRIEISWDGLWEEGDTEMQRHLVIKELQPEQSR